MPELRNSLLIGADGYPKYVHGTRMEDKFVLQEGCRRASLGGLPSWLASSLSTAETLRHEGLVLRAVGGEGKHIGLVELASGPAGVSEVHVAVLVDRSKSGADVLLARSSVTTTDLGNDGLATVGAEPRSKRSERVRDVVSGALCVCATVVGVEVAVYVEDELAGGAVRVLDCEKCRAAVLDESAGRSVVGTGEEEVLRSGTGLANSGDRSLDGCSPGRHCEVVRLVHQTECDVLLGLVLRGNLRPDIGELGVGGSTLTDDRTVPSGVVVQVDDAKRTGCQTTLDQLIVSSQDGCIKSAAKLVLDEVLPADGQAVGVELVILGEVLHLGDTVAARVHVTS
jgi:hypothetical protein